jgi:hypothetical protein
MRTNLCSNNLAPTEANQRSVLGDIIYLIRFAAMSIEDFANGPAKLDILEAQVGKKTCCTYY